jgi:hypothetical protein
LGGLDRVVIAPVDAGKKIAVICLQRDDGWNFE